MIIYDVESMMDHDVYVEGFPLPERQPFGVGVVYDFIDDEFYFFGPADLYQLQSLIESKYRTSELDPLVVGFNHIRYDNKLVFANRSELPCLDNVDLMQEFVKAKHNVDSFKEAISREGEKNLHRGLSLNSVCDKTLAREKMGNSQQIPHLISCGHVAIGLQVCLNHVRLTKKLFEFVLGNGYIYDSVGEMISVDLSWVKEAMKCRGL